MAFDLVIRNGTVVDGTGGPPMRADVAVAGDRIAEIGTVSERGGIELDAEGHVVTPGFVDGHTHMDAQVMWDPLGTCSCWHGVTSVVMGNCGFSLAPSSAEGKGLVVRNLERAEDIAAEAMASGIRWSWETYGEYLDTVEALPKGINYAGYVGHSALRTWAMGERAFSEEATEEDLGRMEHGLAEALDAGALGITTSRSANHETADDRPVASRLASWEEFTRLVMGLRGHGGGIVEFAAETEMDSPDPEVRAEVIGRWRDLAVASGCTFMFGISREAYRDRYELVEQATAAGGRVLAQTTCRGITSISSFRTRLPFDRLPEWSRVRALGLDEQRRVLIDPDGRRRLVEEASHGSYGRTIGAETPPPDFTRMRVMSNALGPNPTVAELAEASGVRPAELIIDLALESNFDQLFTQPLPGTAWRDEDLFEIMRHPASVMTFSDSGAHVSQISDASIQTHLLGYWVRERQALSLEEAVRMISSVPAAAFGLPERGVVREGMIADLNVFDPETVAPRLPVVVHDLPGGARRLDQRADGFLATIVAGEVVFEHGAHTGAHPGRLIRRARAVG